MHLISLVDNCELVNSLIVRTQVSHAWLIKNQNGVLPGPFRAGMDEWVAWLEGEGVMEGWCGGGKEGFPHALLTEDCLPIQLVCPPHPLQLFGLVHVSAGWCLLP